MTDNRVINDVQNHQRYPPVVIKQPLCCLNIACGRNLDYFASSQVGKVVKDLQNIPFLYSSDTFVFKRGIRDSIFVGIRCQLLRSQFSCLLLCIPWVIYETYSTERGWEYPNRTTKWCPQVVFHPTFQESQNKNCQDSFVIYRWTTRPSSRHVIVDQSFIADRYYMLRTKRNNGEYSFSCLRYFRFAQFEVAS